MLGDHLTNVGINRDNVSEVLQMYMSAHCANTDLAPLALSLKTKAFQAHTPAQKASILGFLANELASSKAVIRLKTIYAKRTGKREASMGVEENQSVGTPSSAAKRKRKLGGDSEDDDDDDDDSDDQAEEEDDEEEEEIKKVKKVETFDEEFELHKEKPSSLDGQNLRAQSLEQQKDDSQEHEGKKHSQTLFYQQSSCVSKMCRNVGKGVSKQSLKTQEKECAQNSSPMSIPNASRKGTLSSPIHNTPEPAAALTPCLVTTNDTTNIPPPASTSLSFPWLPAPQESPGNTPPTSSPAPSPHLIFQANDQLLRVLTERSGHWFSLLPRNPCDLSSITTTPPGAPRGSPKASSTPGRPRSPPPSPALPLTPSAASASASPHHPTGLLNYPLSALQLMVLHVFIVTGLLTGWWRVSHIEQLRALVDALHSRGIRERGLQRQMQKYLEIIPQVCTKHRDVAMIELRELEESQVSVESVRGWCVEEQAMEMDIAVLQQVEELERKVTAASLQVKGWTYPDPQSEREDLVYYEHKPPTKSTPASGSAVDKDSKEHLEERGEKGGVMRHPDNPLDIAVTRLADLERNIERRYLRSPLGTTIQIRLDNVAGAHNVLLATFSTDAKELAYKQTHIFLFSCAFLILIFVSSLSGEEEVAHGMKVWRKALGEVRSAAQLAMCIQQLQKSIAWERSIMKVASGPSPKTKKPPAKTVASSGGGNKKSGESKKTGKQTGNGEVLEEDSASASNTPKKGSKDTSRKRKTEESSLALIPANQESPVCVKRAKTARDNNRDLGLCRYKPLACLRLSFF
ncbi:hypothetical protein XENOCAPTIV_015439 [Xenoophorus captivus]|uniref:WHIM2 domain-containing protein n=1 Tax=Xenoophorus captivus TaxID=1517983 RepID=A0ABV0Q3I2_9TELE